MHSIQTLVDKRLHGAARTPDPVHDGTSPTPGMTDNERLKLHPRKRCVLEASSSPSTLWTREARTSSDGNPRPLRASESPKPSSKVIFDRVPSFNSVAPAVGERRPSRIAIVQNVLTAVLSSFWGSTCTVPDAINILEAATAGDAVLLSKAAASGCPLEETDAVSAVAKCRAGAQCAARSSSFWRCAARAAPVAAVVRSHAFLKLPSPLQEGATAAILAAKYGHLPCVHVLARSGADFTADTTVSLDLVAVHGFARSLHATVVCLRRTALPLYTLLLAEDMSTSSIIF